MVMCEDRPVCYRLKMKKQDAEAMRNLARFESLRLGQDRTWCDLVRDAIQWMLENRRPVVGSSVPSVPHQSVKTDL